MYHGWPSRASVMFSHVKCALYQLPQIPCVFTGKMRLAFAVTVNSNDTRPTAPGLRIFYQLKGASRKPFQIPCVFPSKPRLAYDVTVNLNDSQPAAPTFLFSKKTRVAGILPHSSAFSGTMRLAFTSQCEFTCDAASPCWMSFLPRENPLRRNRQEVWKMEQRHMLTKEHCK